MMAGDANGLLYQDIIDRNIENLFKMGIDLKLYFKSSLPYHTIESPDPKKYPEYHTDPSTVRESSTLESLNQVYDNYEQIIGCHLI